MGLLKSPVNQSENPLLTSTMTTTNPALNTFNKSKEDFIWFVKKAVTDKKSYSYTELYHCLLKMFVDADSNNDGLVSKESFSKLVDAAGALPRAYGFAPRTVNFTRTRRRRRRPGRRCLIPWTRKQLVSSPSMSGWRTAWSTSWPRPPPLPPTPSLTTARWTSTRRS